MREVLARRDEPDAAPPADIRLGVELVLRASTGPAPAMELGRPA